MSNNNASLYGLFINIVSTNWFRNFDLKKMYNMLLKANIFVEDLNISTLNMME